MPKKPPPPEPQFLVAAITNVARSYFIAENRGHKSPVSDEALVEIVGTIEHISAKLSAHLGETVAITLACSQAFPADEAVPVRDVPALMSISLSKRQRSLMAYLPSRAFWSVAEQIAGGHITHIEATFEPIRYGSGDLHSLHFSDGRKARAQPC